MIENNNAVEKKETKMKKQKLLRAMENNLRSGNVFEAQAQKDAYLKRFAIDTKTKEDAIISAWFARIDRAAWELKLAIDNAPKQ